MSLTKKPRHIFEPNPLACGQAVLAMLSDADVDKIFDLTGTQREIDLKTLKSTLVKLNISFNPVRKQAFDKTQLPRIAVLSLETPKCWHWSLYFDGLFYDPEYGVLSDFPICDRKYFLEIIP